MIARLIGEMSAGMTAVEIYNDGELVWSYRWFDLGCTERGYISGLCGAVECMRSCEDVADYDGGMVDDDGRPIPMDDGGTTGVMLEYSPGEGWSLGEAGRSLGQSSEIIDALMIAGLLDPDEDHEVERMSRVVEEVAYYLGAPR